MGLFSRRHAKPATDADASTKAARDATVAYLTDFVRTRVGVEAYIEPVTNVTQTTVMLVATDGEWTRRRVPDARTAAQLAQALGIPAYDVNRTGYPQRVRDYNARQKIERRRKVV
jgi:hypothetical protein